MSGPERLRRFLGEMTRLVSRESEEAALVDASRGLMAALVAEDDWLPEEFARPHPTYYQQHLLYCDPLERFSVVSFVWGPGQTTPVHDHTVWGVVGMLRGAETCEAYRRHEDGRLEAIGSEVLSPGQVVAVSPTLGDIHAVKNAYDDRVSVSIHAYGADIGAVRRHVFVPETGEAKEFVSGYANPVLPNLWGARPGSTA